MEEDSPVSKIAVRRNLQEKTRKEGGDKLDPAQLAANCCAVAAAAADAVGCNFSNYGRIDANAISRRAATGESELE